MLSTTTPLCGHTIDECLHNQSRWADARSVSTSRLVEDLMLTHGLGSHDSTMSVGRERVRDVNLCDNQVLIFLDNFNQFLLHHQKNDDAKNKKE